VAATRRGVGAEVLLSLSSSFTLTLRVVTTLIAGCGYVGCALAVQLIARGERVIAIRRDAAKIPAGAIAISAELAELGGVQGLDASIDRVVYAASPDASDPTAYRAAYVAGLDGVIAALRRAGAPLERAVLTSSTAVYAQEDGSWIDERSPAEAEGTAAVLREAESIVQRAFATGIALRLGGIYGPGRDRMVRAVAEGTARRPAGSRWTNRIHRDDAASAIAHLLAIAAPERCYVGVDREPAELGEVYAWIAGELGLPPPPVGEGGDVRRSGNKRARSALLVASGWSPRYPTYREGYRAAIDAMRAR
jgi:nucleoside-diphosphate-sugar epimerase